MLQVGTSFVNFRVPRLRPILDGEPIVVVQDGKPIEKNMRRERLTSRTSPKRPRKQGIAKLDDVAWAVMETSGEISFIKKSDA